MRRTEKPINEVRLCTGCCGLNTENLESTLQRMLRVVVGSSWNTSHLRKLMGLLGGRNEKGHL